MRVAKGGSLKKLLLMGGIDEHFAYTSYVDFNQVDEIYWAASKKTVLLSPLITQVFPHIEQHLAFDFQEGKADTHRSSRPDGNMATAIRAARSGRA
jgi:hypothetical protein